MEELPSDLVSLEEENDEDIDTEIQDVALREKLLNINLLISKIESLSGNPTSHPKYSLLTYGSFRFDVTEERSSGSTTTHAHLSLLEYDSFHFYLDQEEFSGELTHVISPPEYDHFYFDLDKDVLCDPGGDVLNHENLLDVKIPTLPPEIFLDQMSLNDETLNM